MTMTLDEINKQLRNARLKLTNRVPDDGRNAFDERMRKQHLRDLIDDLKRRRRELKEASEQ